jgi:hypothetical protein
MGAEFDFLFPFFHGLSPDMRDFVLFLHRSGALLQSEMSLAASNYATVFASNILIFLSMLFQHDPSG